MCDESEVSGSSGSFKKTLSHLPQRPPVDIEFQDLTYAVPQGRGSKLILKSISGQFQSGKLHAILGPSGAGKSTLLNLLAGYKCSGHGGKILVNGSSRNYKKFRKISRYIMQQDLLQPLLTVQEVMEMAAELKLSREISVDERLISISEILSLLRLTKCKNTRTEQLSGGERKRLSIALELLNNPPVLFLDEPTTGLDDLASAQCISLLKQLAEGGRTIICSIHTPSAKLFSTFDNVYVLADGLCTYQGYGPDVIPFLTNLDLPCPTHYNPADFIIEVCSGEYGSHIDKLVTEVDNGRNIMYYKSTTLRNVILNDGIEVDTEADSQEHLKALDDYTYDSSYWIQFKLILIRMWKQMLRDKMYLLLRLVVIIIIGLLVGTNYLKMGSDGSKTIFNFGFYYTTVIKFLYIPLMPVLLSFPMEIQLVKREYFNRWYDLKPYFCALTVSTLPATIILGGIYIVIVYLLTDQPLELDRFVTFFVICIITGLISESMGLLISSTLNIINGMFIGPCVSVPLMLLAVYGMGYGTTVPIPFLIRLAQYFSYLRYSIHGLTVAMLRDRGSLVCPEEARIDRCIMRNQDDFLKFMGFATNADKETAALYNAFEAVWIDIAALVAIYTVFRLSGFYLLKQRLRPNKAFRMIQFTVRHMKSQMKML